MVAIIIIWGTIFFVLFSFGDLFINIYNKYCKKEERYNILDTFITGLCFTLIPLSLSSLWLPSDQYILLSYIFISIIYWIIFRHRAAVFFNSIKRTVKSLSRAQLLLISFFTLILFQILLITFPTYDADYYHLQFVKWNTDFPVVPGLANLEDRYGFNSNYLLLSSIFSFAFLFDEPYFHIQSVLLFLMLVWGTARFFSSARNTKYFIFLLLLFFLIGTNLNMFETSSTDIVPILCIFYFIVKTLLQPDWLKKQPLMACFLPLSLITFKFSTILFCLVILIPAIYLIKTKQYKNIVFISVFSFIIILLWCIRNVIISGYLVYPLAYIDIFSFDWKVPKTVLLLQKEYITDYAHQLIHLAITQTAHHSWGTLTRFMIDIIVIINSVFSLLVTGYLFIYTYKHFKKKAHLDKAIYIIYLISVLSLTINMINSPDPRFSLGFILGCLFIMAVRLTKRTNYSPKTGIKVFCLIGCLLLMFSIRRDLVSIYKPLDFLTQSASQFKGQNLICKPFHLKAETNLTEYEVGGFTFYISHEALGKRTLYTLPTTNFSGLPFETYNGFLKVQSIKTIEPRGNTLKDGFRTKEEYIKILDENFEQYKKDYKEQFMNW